MTANGDLRAAISLRGRLEERCKSCPLDRLSWCVSVCRGHGPSFKRRFSSGAEEFLVGCQWGKGSGMVINLA